MLLDLPFECSLAVLKRLPVADLVAAGCCCSALRKLVSDDQFWQDLAEARWGTMVLQLKSQADADRQQRISSADAAGPERHGQGLQSSALATDQHVCAASGWMKYCCKRMCLKSIRPSPLKLLQESYPDPWQHIICCVLCSRTSGSSNIRQCIAGFFEEFPTPTACLEASDASLSTCIHPLGLMQSRVAAVKAVSKAFLATDWQEPSEFRGCGKFVADSWKIFCSGCSDATGVDDAKLKQYLAWAKKQKQHPGHNQATDMSVRLADRSGTKIRSLGKDKARCSADNKVQKCDASVGPSKQTRLHARAAAAAGIPEDTRARLGKSARALSGGASRARGCQGMKEVAVHAPAVSRAGAKVQPHKPKPLARAAKKVKA